MNSATIGQVVRVLGRASRKLLLTPRASLLSARMAGWIVLVSVLARLTSLPRVQQIVSGRVRPRPAAAAANQADTETPAQLARTLDSLLRLDLFMFERICWKRALVLHRFLAIEGIESRINFGVQKNPDGTLRGHAWLERDGRPFLEDDAGAYVVTFSLPRRSAAPAA